MTHPFSQSIDRSLPARCDASFAEFRCNRSPGHPGEHQAAKVAPGGVRVFATWDRDQSEQFIRMAAPLRSVS